MVQPIVVCARTRNQLHYGPKYYGMRQSIGGSLIGMVSLLN